MEAMQQMRARAMPHLSLVELPPPHQRVNARGEICRDIPRVVAVGVIHPWLSRNTFGKGHFRNGLWPKIVDRGVSCLGNEYLNPSLDAHVAVVLRWPTPRHSLSCAQRCHRIRSVISSRHGIRARFFGLVADQSLRKVDARPVVAAAIGGKGRSGHHRIPVPRVAIAGVS